MSFYIEKLIISGSGKRDSIIELGKGTNIIYGPSNTGKSYIVKCIDFLFGSKKEPIDVSLGYEYIKLVVKSDCGRMTMSRKIGENKIDVSSNDPRISSGKYEATANAKKHEKTINFVWLTLIGINELHYVVSNINFKKQILSWRTFCHMFMLNEFKIISEESVVLSGNRNTDTATLSSLIYLLYGNDFAEKDTKESKEIKEAKKRAVKTYINNELFELAERNEKLVDKLQNISDIDLEKEIKDLMNQIEKNEKFISQSMAENQSILASLHEKNETLAECNVLLGRYTELTTQYEIDLKRLSFIVDGEANSKNDFASQCPFCDGKIVVKNTHNYIDAAKSDYKKIKLQSKDLEKASRELQIEKEVLEREIKELSEKRLLTEKLIEDELRPQISSLQEKLDLYKDIIECQKEIQLLKSIAKKKSADIIETENEEEDDLKFKPKEYLGYDFFSDLGDNITDFLEECKYDNLNSVRFDKSDMDIVINGKKKSSNGKGYNAYFNSVVAIVLAQYMYKNAKFSSDFLVLDSPILSLKEKETKKPSESMRNALFKYLVSGQEGIQTIVIENEIPNIEYRDANIIHFTKDKSNGRYGLLLDVTD